MKEFHITLAANQGGPGYVLVHAFTEGEARDKMFKSKYGDKWAFLYTSLEKVHPLDRQQLDEIQ